MIIAVGWWRGERRWRRRSKGNIFNDRSRRPGSWWSSADLSIDDAVGRRAVLNAAGRSDGSETLVDWSAPSVAFHRFIAIWTVARRGRRSTRFRATDWRWFAGKWSRRCRRRSSAPFGSDVIAILIVASPQIRHGRSYIFVGVWLLLLLLFFIVGRLLRGAEETRPENGRFPHRFRRLEITNAFADFRYFSVSLGRRVFGRPRRYWRRRPISQTGPFRSIFRQSWRRHEIGRIISRPFDVAIQVIIIAVGRASSGQVSRFRLSFPVARRARGAIFRSRFVRREISAGGRRPCRRTDNNNK